MIFGNKQLLAQLLAEKSITAELRARVASLEAHFDWIAAHVNELKIERAALLERCVGIQLAGVPVIERQSAPLPGADPAYAPTIPPNLGDILNQAREIADDRRRPTSEQDRSIAAVDAGAVSFEDMGDARARDEGVTHNDRGEVVYSKG